MAAHQPVLKPGAERGGQGPERLDDAQLALARVQARDGQDDQPALRICGAKGGRGGLGETSAEGARGQDGLAPGVGEKVKQEFFGVAADHADAVGPVKDPAHAPAGERMQGEFPDFGAMQGQDEAARGEGVKVLQQEQGEERTGLGNVEHGIPAAQAFAVDGPGHAALVEQAVGTVDGQAMDLEGPGGLGHPRWQGGGPHFHGIPQAGRRRRHFRRIDRDPALVRIEFVGHRDQAKGRVGRHRATTYTLKPGEPAKRNIFRRVRPPAGSA